MKQEKIFYLLILFLTIVSTSSVLARSRKVNLKIINTKSMPNRGLFNTQKPKANSIPNNSVGQEKISRTPDDNNLYDQNNNKENFKSLVGSTSLVFGFGRLNDVKHHFDDVFGVKDNLTKTEIVSEVNDLSYMKYLSNTVNFIKKLDKAVDEMVYCSARFLKKYTEKANIHININNYDIINWENFETLINSVSCLNDYISMVYNNEKIQNGVIVVSRYIQQWGSCLTDKIFIFTQEIYENLPKDIEVLGYNKLKLGELITGLNKYFNINVSSQIINVKELFMNFAAPVKNFVVSVISR